MNILKKIWKHKTVLRSLPYTIYFNFHYLPFKQACKFPILLYKPNLLKMKGKIVLDVPIVKMGMIQMGFQSNSLYPNSGIVWENLGGTVIFKGKSHIRNACFISIGNNGCIEFGNNFIGGPNMRLTSYCSILFKENVRIGWETIIMDTSFHKLKDLSGKIKGKIMDPISIGKNNWIPTRCMVMKGTKTPDYCVFGSGSLLNKDYLSYPTHILLAGNPLEIKANEIWRDMSDD